MSDDEIVWHSPFPLTANKKFQDAIADCAVGMAVDIDEDDEKPSTFIVTLPDFRPIGRITARNKVAQALDNGAIVLHATINSIGDPDEDGIFPAPRIRVATGPFGSKLPEDATVQRGYSVHIVGEQNYGAAVGEATEGDRVLFWHEPDNPHDVSAMAVALEDGRTLGYLPRDSWLHRVLLDEGRTYSAKVERAFLGERGFREILLYVVLDGVAVMERPFSGGSAPVAQPKPAPVAVPAADPVFTVAPLGDEVIAGQKTTAISWIAYLAAIGLSAVLVAAAVWASGA